MPDALTTEKTIDTHEMVVIHRAFRRESRLLGELVAAVPAGDTERAAVLGRHLTWYRDGLTNHHVGEDELLWPLLRQRVDVGTEIVVRMELQHGRVADTLTDVLGVLPAWQASAAADRRDELVSALSAHRRVVIEHLDDEENHLLPLAARCLTGPEWAALGGHFVATTPKAKLLIFLGAVLEEATADERAALLGAMPLVPRLAWRSVGRRRYNSKMRQIRGNCANQSSPMSAMNLTEV
jgi:hemerythrin-like domain-containing protein